MIRLDNSIIDSVVLLKRLRQNILMKDICEESNNEVKSINNDFSLSNSEIIQLQQELGAMYNNIVNLNNTWEIKDTKIECYSYHFKRVKLLLKKIIRKMVYWLIKPYWEQQSSFNGAVTRCLSDSLKAQKIILNKLLEDKDEY